MNDLKKKINDALSPFIGQPNNDVTRKQMMPIIRKLMLAALAQDLVSVQPMTSATGAVFNIKHEYLPKYRQIDVSGVPNGHYGIDVGFEVQLWIEQQPIHMWKYIDGPEDMTRVDRQQFLVSEQLYNWMLIRWS